MTITEARRACRKFYAITRPTEEDQFLYTEALRYLIEETKDPQVMLELGSFYYEAREFDLALKYYELAAESGNLYAISNLGYIWYYGRTGEKNFEKAFHYFDRVRKMGDTVAAYKVADMYRNGYYVEKDEKKYRQIIEKLYRKVRNSDLPNDPLPEVFTRLARIRTEEGKPEEALSLYDEARGFLSWRIRLHPFFGDLNIMKWMISDIYKLRSFDPTEMGLYDLFYLLEKPCKVTFVFDGKTHEVEAVEEDGEVVIRLDSRWYRTVDDFFKKAELDGELITMRDLELRDFEVI